MSYPASYNFFTTADGAKDAAAHIAAIAALNDAQFNTASPVDVSEVGSTAEELIRSWA